MRTILALAAAASATVAAVSLANAQECVNGYRELGNEVIVLCDDGFAPEAAAVPGAPLPAEPFVEEPAITGSVETQPLPDEPLTTGSIGAAEPLPEEPLTTGSIEAAEAVPDGIAPPPPTISTSMQAEGPWDCQPGRYWMLESEGSTRPMMC
jgi:hypothetical protein